MIYNILKINLMKNLSCFKVTGEILTLDRIYKIYMH